MRSTSRADAASRNMAAVLAFAAVIAGTNAQAQADPWGRGAGTEESAGRYADLNDIKLYYEIHGSGRPVILLQGGLGAIEIFGPNLPALAKSRQIVAVDLNIFSDPALATTVIPFLDEPATASSTPKGGPRVEHGDSRSTRQ